MLLPDVLSIVPPLTVNVPATVPSAEALLMLRVPALSVVPAVNVFAPVNVRVPEPAFVKLNVLPLMIPPTVSVPPLTVTVRLAFIATAPVPRFRFCVPVNVKFAFQFCALLLVSEIAPPLVLSIVDAPLMVNVPDPIAVALLMFNVPADNVVVPLYVLLPFSVRAPVPFFVNETVP